MSIESLILFSQVVAAESCELETMLTLRVRGGEDEEMKQKWMKTFERKWLGDKNITEKKI